ncbi:hypothetical protein D3C81_1771240 [compost metagenome]
MEKFSDQATALANEFRGFLAVGNVAAIGDIQQRFIRQQMVDLGQYRQAADTGIEYANRRLVRHRSRHCRQGRA